MSNINMIDDRITLIDGYDLNIPNRTGTYVIREKKLALVETSASPSIPRILEGLSEIGISPLDIDYIIITHIHLDHSGGLGLFLKYCPKAKVIVHKKGARHLEDPARLIESAKSVYKGEFSKLFEPILPIPHDAILIKDDKETLKLSESCTFTFYDTPGHASHHLSIHDSVSNGMFTGDTAGIFYSELLELSIEFYLPSTSPNQFNPDAMLKALQLYEVLGINKIYFGHFGNSNNPTHVYAQIKHWLPIFLSAAETSYSSDKSMDEQASQTAAVLFRQISTHLQEKGVPASHRVFDILKLDLKVSALGMADYFIKIHGGQKGSVLYVHD
ncbi:Glyoxylase, beta-lactamase superfamily II [Bacillus sp. OV322]|uniref:MBL fold metallo-hydrolase n=1 Tax=Bacillus sp. OV322 TaxID=1882764 RepID=UPI0008ECFC67|nr:MBL fold metallo-hydrolase [Bacillus sp. OV322]SFC03379.1 Glyoxylase, beta-lactamase superfamily II [Bacillus sp. OV322]